MESSFEFTGSRLWLSREGPWNLTYKSAQTPLRDGEAAKGILSNADFALQLWRACVVAPLNPRAVGSLREAHEYLVSVGIPAKIPMWWKQIVGDLLKPPA